MTGIVQVAPAALDKESSATYCALSVSTFEGLVRAGDAPQPRQLSARRVGWLRVELDQWLQSRPKSELLPPENTGAPKPRGTRRQAAANDASIKPDCSTAPKAA